MSYTVPPSRSPNGRRAGCLCILGALSCIGGALAAGTSFIDASATRGPLIGMQYSGQVTGGLSLVIVLLSGILFVTNGWLIRWLLRGTAVILGMLFVPTAVASVPAPLPWMPILGSLVIGIASTLTIIPARSPWWYDAPQTSPLQVHAPMSSIVQPKVHLTGWICVIGAMMSILASITAWLNHPWRGIGLGSNHNGMITGILSLGILLLSLRLVVATTNEGSIRTLIMTTTVLMGICFLPAALDKIPIGGPGYAMIGVFIILIGATSDIDLHR